MVYKNFRLICTYRVIILSATIFLFLYLILNTTLYASFFIIGLLIIFQTYSLIQYVEKTNQELTRFFDSIKYSDFSQSFVNKHEGKSFTELHDAFTKVANKFREARSEKEAHHRYLQTVVQHVGIGLISFQSDGHIGLINTAAKRLFSISHLKNIKDLDKIDKSISKQLLELRSGNKLLLKIEINNDLIQLVVYATQFQMQGQLYTLVSFQNIGQELEENELESWQKLIRVLTHEIMNSITPISSLASTICNLLAEDETNQHADKTMDAGYTDDVRNGIQTIQKRSEALLNFVDAYRNLTRLPKPNYKIFRVSEVFGQIQQLMQPKVSENEIQFTSKIDPETLEVTADFEMVEQVLINLLINAIQAVSKKPDAKIKLNALLNNQGRVIIEVVDNGSGIPEDVKEKIFIPFFTTKKDGSGIGLSLSRQIMRLHSGTITVNSIPGEKTVFTLKF